MRENVDLTDFESGSVVFFLEGRIRIIKKKLLIYYKFPAQPTL